MPGFLLTVRFWLGGVCSGQARNERQMTNKCLVELAVWIFTALVKQRIVFGVPALYRARCAKVHFRYCCLARCSASRSPSIDPPISVLLESGGGGRWRRLYTRINPPPPPPQDSHKIFCCRCGNSPAPQLLSLRLATHRPCTAPTFRSEPPIRKEYVRGGQVNAYLGTLYTSTQF